MAKHMHSHNAQWSRGLVVGLLTDLVDCIKELSLQGYVVKIDDLGLFKATVESNGLTLKQGARVSAARGSQRKDTELQQDITTQQFAIRNVKLLVQATGETTMDNMNDGANTVFTSKAKALIKSLTGNESNASSLTPDPSPTGEGSDNQSGGGSGSGSQNSGSGENSGSGSNSGSGNSGSQSQQSGVAAPVIGGDAYFQESTQVTITGPEGASIYYSESGDDPDTTDTLYTQPFTISEDTTVKAIAVKDGVTSEVTVKNFTKGSDDSGGFETAG